MANWIELPGDLFVNLDRIDMVYIKQLTNPSHSWQVEGRGNSGTIPLAGPFSDPEKAAKVQRAIMKLVYSDSAFQPTSVPVVPDNL